MRGEVTVLADAGDEADDGRLDRSGELAADTGALPCGLELANLNRTN